MQRDNLDLPEEEAGIAVRRNGGFRGFYVGEKFVGSVNGRK